MSLIAHIDNVPLFSTIEEAQAWGNQYNLTGYHEHEVLGQIGYMGGKTHMEIVSAMMGGPVRTSGGVTIQTTPVSTSGSVSGGGGGGGGY
tara:strand:+ start:250 stop:519 length:270 start_codon:yes stop_codon:yes gene_type:complete